MEPNRLPFRPIDNSPSTRLGYSLEAQHWLRAINSAQASTAAFGSTLGLIGALLVIAFSVIFIVLALVIKLLIAILSLFEGGEVKESEEFDVNKYPHTPNYIGQPDEKYFRSWK